MLIVDVYIVQNFCENNIIFFLILKNKLIDDELFCFRIISMFFILLLKIGVDEQVQLIWFIIML